MNLIYMQSTIDYFHSKDPYLLDSLLQYGEPEIKEIIKKYDIYPL